MPTPNTSRAEEVTNFSPAEAVANTIDALIESLVRLGLAARTEVRLLVAIHRVTGAAVDWHRNDDVLATLQNALDLVYDLVARACPVWREGNANDLHVRAYSLVVVLWGLHRVQTDRESGVHEQAIHSGVGPRG